MNPPRPPSSKKFLINRIVDQAKQENIPLSDVEVRMLGFAEATASSKDIEVAQEFEREIDDVEYETKIAALIQHAYELDKKSGIEETWKDALARIASQDIYLNVLIDRAGIHGSGDNSIFGDWHFFIYGLLPCGLALVAALMVGFSPLGVRLIHNEVIRLLLAIFLIALPFVLQRVSRFGPSLTRKERRRSLP